MHLPAAEANWFVALINKLAAPQPSMPVGNPVPNLYGSASGKFHTDTHLDADALLSILREAFGMQPVAPESNSVESRPNATFLPRRE